MLNYAIAEIDIGNIFICYCLEKLVRALLDLETL